MEVFRHRRLLAGAMAVATALWLLALWWLLKLGDAPAHLVLSALSFAVFFALALLYYARAAFIVDGGGVTYRGFVRTFRFGFADVRKVDVLSGPVTVYSVRAKGRMLYFTSFFRGHRRLMALLIQRAGMA